MKSVDQVVVLSGSMEPGLQRGDILLLGCTACACYAAMGPPPLGSRMVKGIHFDRDTASRCSIRINLHRPATWNDLESASSWFFPSPESNAFARQVSYSLFRAAITSVYKWFSPANFSKVSFCTFTDMFVLWACGKSVPGIFPGRRSDQRRFRFKPGDIVVFQIEGRAQLASCRVLQADGFLFSPSYSGSQTDSNSPVNPG